MKNKDEKYLIASLTDERPLDRSRQMTTTEGYLLTTDRFNWLV